MPSLSFFLAMFVQAIPGAVGTGMMTMIVYVLLTLVYCWTHGWKNTRIYEYENKSQEILN